MRAACVVLLAAGILAGCNPEGGPASAPEAPLPDAPAPLTGAKPATTSPTSVQPPATELRLTTDGYGPVRIGMTRAEVVRAWGEDAQPDAVGGPDPAQCDEFRPKDAPAGTLVMIENGRLTRISLIRDSKISTDSGLRLGATEAEVRAAYGDRLTVEPHKYVDAPARYLLAWAKPDARGVLYETDGQSVVRAIRAGTPSIRYVEGCA